MIVTCRTEQYQAAVSSQDGQGAALRGGSDPAEALPFHEVASYLRRDAGPAGQERWSFL